MLGIFFGICSGAKHCGPYHLGLPGHPGSSICSPAVYLVPPDRLGLVKRGVRRVRADSSPQDCCQETGGGVEKHSVKSEARMSPHPGPDQAPTYYFW